MNLQIWKFWFLRVYVLWQNRFDRLYRISLRERPKKFRLAHTYGEIPMATIQQISSLLSFQKETRFLELGSGIGIFSLYISLLHESQCRGVEMLPSFVRSSQRCSHFLSLPCTFEQGDLWEMNWSNYDIIYLTTTTFPQDWLLKLEAKVDEISLGAFLIVLTNQIQNSNFSCVHSFIGEFSWGVATVFMYQRK